LVINVEYCTSEKGFCLTLVAGILFLKIIKNPSNGSKEVSMAEIEGLE
jgi:hypothetical protein